MKAIPEKNREIDICVQELTGCTKFLWHTVSRESELYRIGEVIFWYADYLRDLKGL